MPNESAPAAPLTPDEISERTARAVGHHYVYRHTYLVGREKIREYALASQFSAPVHFDVEAARAAGYADLVAPPMLVSVAGIVSNRPLFDDSVIGYGASQLMQADESMVYHRPVVAGHELTIHVHVDKHRRVGGYDMVTIRNEMYSQDDEHLVTLSTTLIGGSPDGADAPDFSDAAEKIVMHGVINA
ncbi:MaoC family dehydratase N-terminal domain-containing protein [Tsukamurella paurometabola]|uniref:(3R)-hydroxyacyl-ACP dehydratase subunit HadA n=1 Tax=Tsukamurella paurometabola TaxID=2061 RepID=A0A3P8KFG4_TSUPA|nr:MaoC family dehydratase N-terminal domain-containing protein [Tsukamurella paurometabola]MBS4102616.1 MaoC family dehydratase N-terminal domain-containing protein [Tsukamurella paurometabola]UEA81660.1 MaoC family dehydratase N-terminal domain-containing protein [Tsukamurella paurometabola]VDR38668.1 (3R)-hydroxyacyl-ACP dehydratase subunit HadA [Tsukamurella paurometabola]